MKDYKSLAIKRLQPIIDKIGWATMVKREKLMVGGMLIAVAALILYHFLLSPLLDSRQRLQKSLLKKQVALQQVQKLQQEYESLQHTSGDIQQRVAKRPKSFTLFSFIEQKATSSGIKEKINYMKPSEVESDALLQESRVDMKLEKITLKNLVDFLKGVESTQNVVSINRISIQEYGKEQGYLNAIIQIATFKTGETK